MPAAVLRVPVVDVVTGVFHVKFDRTGDSGHGFGPGPRGDSFVRFELCDKPCARNFAPRYGDGTIMIYNVNNCFARATTITRSQTSDWIYEGGKGVLSRDL